MKNLIRFKIFSVNLKHGYCYFAFFYHTFFSHLKSIWWRSLGRFISTIPVTGCSVLFMTKLILSTSEVINCGQNALVASTSAWPCHLQNMRVSHHLTVSNQKGSHHESTGHCAESQAKTEDIPLKSNIRMCPFLIPKLRMLTWSEPLNSSRPQKRECVMALLFSY